MENNQNKKYYINEKLSSFKLSLSYITVLLGIFDKNKEEPDEPLLKIVNYDDIIKILELKEKNNIKKYFYLNRKKIGKLLYIEDEIITFDKFPKENLSSYFYLSLLIKESGNVVNYIYNLEYIQDIFNKMGEIGDKPYKKLIISNIILDMIKAYKEFDDYNEYNDEIQLDNIENESKKIIDVNIKKIKPEFESKNIEEFYIKIIKYLLTNISEDLTSILEQLDIKNINITSTIFNELSNSLSDKDFTKNYIINELNDLEDEKIINFYYILFIYVLKDPLYIYQNDFLLKIKRKIIEIFKAKSIDYYIFIYNNNFLNNDKLNDIISFFVDSKYYIKSIKDDISETKDIINKIIKDSSFLFEINENNKPKFIMNKEIKIGKIILKYEDLKKIKIYDNNFKDYEKFLTIFDDFKNLFDKKLDIKNSLKIALNFKKENKIENLYLNFITENNNNKLYTIRDILNIKSLSNEKEFLELIGDINNYISTKTNINSNFSISNSISQPKKAIFKIFPESNSNPNSFKNNIKEKEGIKNKSLKNQVSEITDINNDKYKIIDTIEIIGNHRGESEYIQEYSNEFLISVDSRNNFFLYDSNYKKINSIENGVINCPLNIYRKNYSSDGVNEKLELIACSKVGLLEINCNISNNNDYASKIINHSPCSVYFNVGNNDYIIGGEKGIFHYKAGNIINNIKDAFRGGIKINKDIIAFTSNTILPNGNDELIFYSIKEDKNILNKKMNYSFTKSTNSLSLMTCQENKCEVLLCGCKKYCNNQKNGILLINLNLPSYPEKFMDLRNFEVYCFCPISIINEDKNNSMEKTNYFLVGGFEAEKGEGMIKLFKIKKMNNSDNRVGIEYIQDIKIETIKTPDKNNKKEFQMYIFYGFERTVSSIIQSKFSGKILITSWEGRDYVCNTPNIKYYLKEDKKRKEEKIPN